MRAMMTRKIRGGLAGHLDDADMLVTSKAFGTNRAGV